MALQLPHTEGIGSQILVVAFVEDGFDDRLFPLTYQLRIVVALRKERL